MADTDLADYVVDGFKEESVAPSEAGTATDAPAATGGDAPGGGEEQASGAGDAEAADEGVVAMTLSLRLPSGREVPLFVGSNDHVGLIRQFIAGLPEVCCETSYELHVRAPTPGTPPSVLALFVPLEEYGLSNGDVVRLVRLPYNAHTAQSHVRRLRDVLKSPPYPRALPVTAQPGVYVLAGPVVPTLIVLETSMFAFLYSPHVHVECHHLRLPPPSPPPHIPPHSAPH
jgi:hypothetical protein